MKKLFHLRFENIDNEISKLALEEEVQFILLLTEKVILFY